MKIKVVMGLVLSVTMVFNIAGVSYASVEASEMNEYENNLNNVLDYNEVDIIYSELESEYSYYHSSEPCSFYAYRSSGIICNNSGNYCRTWS